MAKNSGNIRSNARRQRITEQGYSARLASRVLAKEREIRTNRDESLFFYDAAGNVVSRLQGEGGRVIAPKGYVAPRNAIITHNHPRALGQTGVRAIGHSFSYEDLRTAINTDAQEIRAVTPTYTFSVKRPPEGWGTNATNLWLAFGEAERQVRNRLNSYVWRRNTDDAVARAETLHHHLVLKQLAKRFGWKYTKTNS